VLILTRQAEEERGIESEGGPPPSKGQRATNAALSEVWLVRSSVPWLREPLKLTPSHGEWKLPYIGT